MLQGDILTKYQTEESVIPGESGSKLLYRLFGKLGKQDLRKWDDSAPSVSTF